MELSGMLKLERNARKRSDRCRRPRRFRAAARLSMVVCLAALSCSTLGCQSLKDLNRAWFKPKTSEKRDPSGTTPAASVDSAATKTTGPPSDPQAPSTIQNHDSGKASFKDLFGNRKEDSPFRIDDVEAILAKSGGWMGTPVPKQDKVPWNWYHPQIEEILAWPKENDRAIRLSLQKKEPVSATNAAICLARCGDTSGVSILIGAIRSPRLDMSLRAAAAEAFASLDSSVQTVQKLIDEFSDEGKTPRPVLYRELITGLARHVDPAGDTRFLKALRSQDVDVRNAAIEAWKKSQGKVLPDEVVHLAADSSEKNRCAVMHALGTHDHPQRMHYLDSGLRDINYLVRIAAVESLGQIGTQEAIDRLQESTKSNSPIVRAAAVRSFAQAGRSELALPLVKDEAWQVRLAVAEALPKIPSGKALEAAGELLHDRTPRVQQEILSSIKGWPLAQSGPLLLDAIENLSFHSRQEAITQLASQWEPARNFPRHAPEDVRKRAIIELRSEFQKAFGSLDQYAANPVEQDTSSSKPVQIDPELILRAKRLIAKHDDPRCASADRYQIRQMIRNDLGRDPLAVLEHLVFEEHQDLPEAFYTTVLPDLDPTFDILYKMQIQTKPVSSWLKSQASLSRRRAASKLIRLTAERQPSRLALDRLAELMLQETDPLVWRSVMIALADNGSESMLQMVRIAIGHDSSDIRRRACEWLAAHPDPDHFHLLKPALNDSDLGVKVAAVRAVVAGGKLKDSAPLQNMLDDTQASSVVRNLPPANNPPPTASQKEIEPLKKLLGDTNEELRVEVAYALAAFGDENGVQAIKQLAQSRDANVRQKAAEAMGRLEDPRYTSFLIQLLDDHLNVRRAALNSLPKTVGHEVPAAGNYQPQTTAEITARWKEWYANHNRGLLR